MDIHLISFLVKCTGWLMVLLCLIIHKKRFPLNLFYLGLMATSLLLYATFEEFFKTGILIDDKIMWIVADMVLMLFIIMGIKKFDRNIKTSRDIKKDISDKRQDLGV